MLRPLRDQIVVKPIERKASDILYVMLSERPNIGTIVAVGPGLRNKRGRIEPLDVQVGDLVRWGEFAFPEYWEGNQKYLVLQEADIAGIVEVNGYERPIEEIRLNACACLRRSGVESLPGHQPRREFQGVA